MGTLREQLVKAITGSTKPTVAVIGGFVVGIGLSVVKACGDVLISAVNGDSVDPNPVERILVQITRYGVISGICLIALVVVFGTAIWLVMKYRTAIMRQAHEQKMLKNRWQRGRRGQLTREEGDLPETVLRMRERRPA